MATLGEVYQQIAACRKCENLARTRSRVVPGEGAEDARIIFIGEAPGFHEDQEGRPFVGAAGQYLDKLIASIGLERSQVYITNVIKCRPPANRDPFPTEILNCAAYLDRQMEAIHPRMIITLGRYSMAKFFPGKTISKIHGTAQVRNNVIYFAMYHPAAALHQQSLRSEIEADMLKIPSLLVRLETPAPEKPAPSAQQLKMF